MKMTLTSTTREEQAREDIAYWRSRTPEERLDHVEQLHVEAWKFLYDYPVPLQKIVSVTWREPR